MLKRRMKTSVKYISGRCSRYVRKEKKKLQRIGAIVLAVITITGGFLIFFKHNSEPTLQNEPAKEIVVKDDRAEKERIFLEKVEALKSGIYSTSYLVFGEEKLRVNETVGESSKDVVTVQGDFRVKYSIDLRQMKVDYNFNNNKVVLNIPKNAVKVDSVELLGDIQETYKYESWGNKIKKIVPQWNNDEEMKELAIRQLMKHSKQEANKYDNKELENKAEKELSKLVEQLNYSDLDYEINFIDAKTIGIRK